MKFKCVKAECPNCKIIGSIQLFLNKDNQVKYARTRHYSHLDKDSKKPQFSYCKINDLEVLQTLIKSIDISLSTNIPSIGQLGQNIHDQKLKDLTSKVSGCSLVWLGHQPPTLTTRVQIPATALSFFKCSRLKSM